ncbi:MAG: DUF1501 domain-containing protein [Planctomycetia bacterium]|nr:DUF1501 domain-containing protein [Planctomycetia bacterium]
MLTLTENTRTLSRRGFLTLGTLGLGGLSLSSLLKAAEEQPNHITGRSVIFLFQQGGPSQYETFDPKPEAPEGIRTVTGTVDTALHGVRFGDTMSQLAKLADKFTVVRSFQTNNGGHNIQPMVSADTLNANMGSLYSRVVGATRPATGMPTNTVLFPQSVCPDVAKGAGRGDLASTGELGQVYAPFVVGAGGQLQANMRLNLARDRFEDRKGLLAELSKLNKTFESAESAQTVDKFQDQAAQLLLSGGVAEALDLTREDAKTLARYDTAKYARPDGWSKAARGKKGYYTGQAKSIGKLLLLARRLCEAGCGFVTVHADYEGVWDMHADGNNLNMIDGMEAVGRSFDHAVAAFIEDVEARGLSDKIMLVCCGEMGRTPKLNKNGGRDHWAKLAPLMVYGGGTKGGQVIGQSTKDGGEPATENFTPKHLISTILHSMFDVGQLRLLPGFGQINKLAEHPTITGLI